MTRVFRGLLLVADRYRPVGRIGRGAGHRSIFGKVTDPSGGMLPGVTVTVTGPALQRPLVAVTTESGAYQIPSVPIGTFTVTFELASFKKAVASERGRSTTGLQRPDRPEARARPDVRRVDGHGGQRRWSTPRRRRPAATFTKDIFENIPTARDPWQIIGMTPGVQAGLNVGGSASGPAGRPVGVRHERERAVEPRRRVDHRPVVELLAGRTSTSTRSNRSRW